MIEFINTGIISNEKSLKVYKDSDVIEYDNASPYNIMYSDKPSDKIISKTASSQGIAHINRLIKRINLVESSNIPQLTKDNINDVHDYIIKIFKSYDKITIIDNKGDIGKAILEAYNSPDYNNIVGKCGCNKNITFHYVLRNTKTHNILFVGSTCINLFLNDNSINFLNRFIKNNKKVYRCDICDTYYKHGKGRCPCTMQNCNNCGKYIDDKCDICSFCSTSNLHYSGNLCPFCYPQCVRCSKYDCECKNCMSCDKKFKAEYSWATVCNVCYCRATEPLDNGLYSCINNCGASGIPYKQARYYRCYNCYVKSKLKK